MGDWNISIQGSGAHHNADFPEDAEKMAKRFVQELRGAGHSISSAMFTSGGREDIDSPPVLEHMEQSTPTG